MMCCPFPFFLFVVCLFVHLCCFFAFFFVFIYLLFCSSFIKLVLFRFLARFSISRTYLNLHKCNSLLYILGSTNIPTFSNISIAQCHFFVYLKVGGGQLESLCYFDHHTHFIICTVFIFIL